MLKQIGGAGMIRVLIVEDDKFARQGMIHSLPWERHGMTVAGEASGGKAALEILAKEKIDLMLCDYSMPGMNGLELLKNAKELYPDLSVGMITLYESFDIIQQAMRYGAIDYISKLQLEEENYDQMLDNLTRRVLERREVQQKARPVLVCPQDACYIISCINSRDPGILCEKHPSVFLERPVEIGLNVYAAYLPDTVGEESVFGIIRKPWYVLKVSGLAAYEQDAFFHLVRRYYRYHMFYSHENMAVSITWLEKMVNSIPSISEDVIATLQSSWSGTEWFYEDEVFREQLQVLREQMLPFNVLFKLLVRIEDAIKHKYGDLFGGVELDLPYNFSSWEEVGEWLEAVHCKMKQAIWEKKLSDEILKSVTKAIQIISDEMDAPLLLSEVAERVNMSRSYFSACFKKVTGKSFNQYVRDKRIRIAQEYLEETEYTVMEIALKCGYEDEKYFGKVFRQETGYLPTRYRKEKREKARLVL